MRQFIYARTSTDKQDNQNQILLLQRQYPDAEIIQEIASGGRARPKLAELVERLEKGDMLIIGSLDRLGRRMVEVISLVELLTNRGVLLRSVREGIDYGTVSGKLIFQVLASVAELERSLISERTKSALAAKREKGIVGGRPRIHSDEKIQQARQLRADGCSLAMISKEVGISISRLHQLLK